jgi:hypothetical protein
MNADLALRESTPLAALAERGARKESRVKVNWMARAKLANGRVADLRVRDITEEGIGLAGEVGIPPHTVLTFELAVPALNDNTRFTMVVCTMKTSHATVRGLDLIYGGTWVSIAPEAMELIRKWLKRLRS